MAEPQADIALFITTPSGLQLASNFGDDKQKVYLQSKDLDLGDPRISKHVYRVISRIKRRVLSPNLKLTLQYRNDLNEDRVSADKLNLAEPTEVHKVRLPGAKYISILIEDSIVQDIWNLAELKFEGVLAAGRR